MKTFIVTQPDGSEVEQEAVSENEAIAIVAAQWNQASQPEQPPANDAPMYQESRDRARSAGQGFTMGLLDEATGAVGASANSIAGLFGGGTGAPWPEAYADIRDAERAEQARFAKDNPGMDLGLQAAGGLVTGIGSGGRLAATKAGQKVMRMGAVPRSATIGATGGAAEGFGRAEGDALSQLAQTGIGAAIGGVTGPALELVGRGAGKAMTYVKRRALEGAKTRGQRAVQTFLGESTPNDIIAEMADLGEGAMPADVDSLYSLALLSSATTPGRTAAKREAKRRLQAQQPMLVDKVRTIAADLGDTGRNMRSRLRALKQSQRAAAKTHYDRAYSAKTPNDDPELLELLERPSVRKAFAVGQRVAKDEGESGDQLVNMFARDAEGRPKFSANPDDWEVTPVPTWKEWDYIQRGLRKMAGNARVSAPDNARTFDALRREVTKRLDVKNPDFYRARRVYAGHQALQDAAEEGGKVLGPNRTLEEVSDLWEDLTPSERQPFLSAVFKDIQHKVGAIRENANIGNNALFNAPNSREKLKLFFGDESGDMLFDELTDLVELSSAGVRKMNSLANRTVTGDIAQATRQAQEAADGGNLMADLLQGGPAAAAMQAMRRNMGGMNPMDDPQTQQLISDAMFDKTGNNLRALMQGAPQAAPINLGPGMRSTVPFIGGMGGGLLAPQQ